MASDQMDLAFGSDKPFSNGDVLSNGLSPDPKETQQTSYHYIDNNSLARMQIDS